MKNSTSLTEPNPLQEAMMHGAGTLEYDEKTGHSLYVPNPEASFCDHIQIDLAAVPEHVVVQREVSETLNQAGMDMIKLSELQNRVRDKAHAAMAKRDSDTAEGEETK